MDTAKKAVAQNVLKPVEVAQARRDVSTNPLLIRGAKKESKDLSKWGTVTQKYDFSACFRLHVNS